MEREKDKGAGYVRDDLRTKPALPVEQSGVGVNYSHDC